MWHSVALTEKYGDRVLGLKGTFQTITHTFYQSASEPSKLRYDRIGSSRTTNYEVRNTLYSQLYNFNVIPWFPWWLVETSVRTGTTTFPLVHFAPVAKSCRMNILHTNSTKKIVYVA